MAYDELPAWLRGHIHPYPGEDQSFAADEPAPAPSPAAPAPSNAETYVPPANFDAGAAAGAADAALPTDLKGLTGDLPWMQDIDTSPDAAASTGADAASAGGWQPDEAPAAPSASPLTGQPADGLKGLTGDLPWMQDVGASPDAAASTGADDGGALDWMAAPEAPEPAPAAPEDDLGWLAAEDEAHVVEAPADVPADVPADGDADWLAMAEELETDAIVEESAAPESAAGPDVPDWLAAADAVPVDEAPPPPAAAEPDAAVPDWLAAAGSLADDEADDEAAESDLGDLDWMAAADELLADEEFAADDAPLPSAEADAAPDWLASAGELAPEDDADDIPLADAPAEEVPAWMLDDVGDMAEDQSDGADFSYEEWQDIQEEEEYEPSVEEQLAEEVPDWFASMDADADDSTGPLPVEPALPGTATAEFVPDWYLGLDEQDTSDAPEWFGSLDFSTDALTAQPVLPAAPEPEAPPAPTPEAPPPAAADLTEEVPDWLADVGSGSAAPAVPVPPTPAADTPEWLADVGQPSADVPDWLADVADGLPAGSLPGLPVDDSAPLIEELPSTGELGFMADVLGSDAERDAVAASAAALPSTGELDFLSDMLEPGDTPPVAAEPPAPVAAEPPAPVAAEPSAADEESLLGEEFDFLSDDALAPGDDVPDWFEDAVSAAEPAAPVAAESPAVDEEALLGEGYDFLAGMLADDDAPPVDVLPDELPAEAADTPDVDWLGAFESEAAGTPVDEPSPDAGPLPVDLAPGETPDWLGALAAPEEPAPPISAEDAEFEALFAGGDDFMSVIEGELGDAAPAAGSVGDAALLSMGDSSFGLDDLLDEEGLPPLDEQSVREAQALAEQMMDMPQADEDALPEGLAGADMPDWLASAQLGPDGAELVEGEFSAADAALRQPEADEDALSARLLALRGRTENIPAAAAPDTTGPEVLDGVADVLQPTTAFDSAEGRSVLLDVQLDEQQEAQVETLAALLGVADLHKSLGEAPPIFDELDENGDPLPPPEAEEEDEVDAALRIREADKRARARSSRKPMRMVVTVILLVAVVLPFFVDFSDLIELPAAVLNPSQHGAMDGSIQSLSPGDLVLVGFEYGPTAAGEMDPLSETLLTHILLRGAKPVIVSTKAAGILHAADVLDALAHDEFLLAHLGRPANEPLSMPEDYVILSYLPGGIVGLRALTATSIDSAALDRGLFLVDYQGNPTGLNVRYMQMEFPLVLTLAERGEDVRNWVEQVGAAVDLPLVAGVSVAAEPVARPYLDSGQLGGLLAGYRDAYIYSRVLTASLPSVPGEQPPLQGMVRGLQTNIPTPTPRLTATPTPTEVVEADAAEDDEAAGDEAAAVGTLPDEELTETRTPTPTFTPTERVFATVTLDVAAQETLDALATAGAQGTMTPIPTATPLPPPEIDPAVMQAEQVLADKRWYSMTVGALAAVGIIALGAIVNIIRSRRRRS